MGRLVFLCNNCKEDLVPLVERMKNHVSKCKASPPADDIEIIDEPRPSTSKRKKWKRKRKRQKMAVTPVMLAANLLDHRYCGSNMSPIEVQEALAYIASVDDTCLAGVTKFMARHTPYNEKLFEGSFADVSSSTWWKSGGKLGFDPNLITCAISIVSSVSSSGGLELQFSTLGMNYGKLRSHLGVEKAGKLAFLYRQLNNKD